MDIGQFLADLWFLVTQGLFMVLVVMSAYLLRLAIRARRQNYAVHTIVASRNMALIVIAMLTIVTLIICFKLEAYITRLQTWYDTPWAVAYVLTAGIAIGLPLVLISAIRFSLQLRNERKQYSRRKDLS